ncbi:MAG: FecR domain-containing protein, partial [Mariprofundaceae bacterium]
MLVRIVIISLLLVFPFVAQASGNVGKVSHVSGDAWIVKGTHKTPITLDSVVHEGDVISTSNSGRVKLFMKDKTTVFVGRKSKITIDHYEMKEQKLASASFNMFWGKIRFLVSKMRTGSSDFAVKTTTATIGVRGTDFIAQKPIAPKAPTKVSLFSGRVVASSISGKLIDMKPGQQANFNVSGKINVTAIPKNTLKNSGLGGKSFGEVKNDPAAKKNDSEVKKRDSTAKKADPIAKKKGKTTLKKGRTTLKKGRTTLKKGKATLKKGRTTLKKGNASLNKGRTTLKKGRSTLKKGNAALKKG